MSRHAGTPRRRRASTPAAGRTADLYDSRIAASRITVADFPAMLWLGDAEGRRTFFSQHWLTFTGRSEPLEIGHSWLKGLQADDRQRYLEEFRAASCERRALRTSYGLRRFDGAIHRVLEEARPRFGRNGRLIGFIGVCIDAENLQGADRTQAETDELRRLSGRLEAARDEERSRLARELHDELGQLLTSTKLDLMWLCEQVRQPGARPSLSLVNKLQSLAGLVELAIATVQRITTDLKPAVLDHFGLEAALESEARKFHARTGIRCRVESRMENTHLDPSRATALFRIAQESLTNVARHARAGAVRLSLRQAKGRIVLEVRDNGRGITERELTDVRAAGLLGMKERAHLLGGDFLVSGVPGRGTKVHLSIPARASN